MADEGQSRKPIIAGAICCFTGDEIDADELIHIHVELGPGSKEFQTFFTTPDRLRAAFHPSVDVDFGVFDDEEDGT